MRARWNLNHLGEMFTALDRWQWKRDVAKKSSNFKDTRQNFSVPLAMSTNLRNFVFKIIKNAEKSNSWADIGPKSAWEKLSQMLIRSGEIPSPRQTSIDKNNDYAMKSEWGALVRGSDPPSGHSVHKNGRWYVAGAGLLLYASRL